VLAVFLIKTKLSKYRLALDTLFVHVYRYIKLESCRVISIQKTTFFKLHCHIVAVFLIKTELSKYNTEDFLKLVRQKIHCKKNFDILKGLEQNFRINMLVSVFEFLSAFNILLSITASLGNALILIALHKENSLHPPTKLLFRCLAITDLCVGVISQPLFAVLNLSDVTPGMNREALYQIDQLNSVSSFVLCSVSVLTSSAISADRLLALLSGLRYRQVVTLPRVRAAVICLWSISISCGLLYLWNIRIGFTVFFALVMCCLAHSVFSYAKIYVNLRQYHLQVPAFLEGQPNGRKIPLKIARYKKSVSNVLWVQLALVTCYIPFVIVVLLMTHGRMFGGNFQVAFGITATLTYLNSSLNPILYCWRIRAVRQAAKDTIKQLNCCKSD